MYKSYFIIAWRNILRNKGYTAINILGLSIGIAACILIALYVQFELSYDRFNLKADRVYRVNNEIKFGDNHLDLAVTNAIFGETAKHDFQQIETYARLTWYGSLLIKKGNENIREGNVAWADSTLFDVFTLPMISGNPKTALAEPNSIVITESIAMKYFGATDVAGQTLVIDNKQIRKVTGVIKDVPLNCHFRFNLFLPLVENEYAKENNWAGGQNWNTYLLLKPDTDANALVPELNKMLDRNLGPQLKTLINKTLEEFNNGGDYFKVSLTPLADIHLHSDRMGELWGSGDIRYVYIFSAIGLFILLIACINFMNLATARSAKRAREVGVRKVMGSLRRSLVGQFLSEALLTTAFALVVAYAICWLSLPYFIELTEKGIDKNVLLSPWVLGSFGVFLIVVGFLTGTYPAFYLSSFQPVAVLKGSKGTSFRKSLFRNVLVVFQFSASVVLIVGTIIIYMQLDYIRKKDIGYNREQILILNNTWSLEQKAEPFKNELLKIAGVEKATISGYLPVNYTRNNDSFFPLPSMDTKDAISMQIWEIDENYIPTMEMEIVEGRNFSADMKTDSTGLIVNEAAAKFMGNEGIINKSLYRFTNPQTKETEELRIVGIVKDFNFSSLREQVKPLAFKFGASRNSISLKINTSDVQGILAQIKTKWEAVSAGLPLEYSFMDDDFNQHYTGDRKIGELFTIFAVLAIFIACLGLFGLATFIAEQRTKEIGIRKVLGANISAITALLSKDFVRLVIIAIVIASPLAYYFMDKWLEAFAYRIDIQWWVFIAAGILVILIALFTVSFQAIKTALMNPVNSLRSE
jgi:putative ABC transport system permease protein